VWSATTRKRFDLLVRSRQPTHVRTGRVELIAVKSTAWAYRLANPGPKGPCRAAYTVAGFLISCGGESERMSIRQPVIRAARRAFCPSLPIASESW